MRNALSTAFIGLFLSITFISCSSVPAIGYNTAGNLTKNEELSSVKAYLNQEPVITKELVLPGSTDSYKVLIYKRWIMTYGFGSFYALFNTNKFDLFVFSFKNDKLHFWGNLDDFKKSDDTAINTIGTFVSDTWINH